MFDVTNSIYRAVTLALKAKVVVELGTGVGLSTDSFLAALKLTDGKLYSVDIYPHGPTITEGPYAGQGGPLTVKGTIERFKGENRVTFVSGDSVEVGKKWDKGDIDILLCDTHNTGPELEVWGKFNPKVIFVHDTLPARDKPGYAYHAAKTYAEKEGRTFFNFVVDLGVCMIV